jgi:pimeloyl-ACP methyl ester carboxylesterase
MPSLELDTSPLAGGEPVTIGYDQKGRGPVVIFLHGGWGYDAYPIDIDVFAATSTVLIPRRSGYGSSSPLEAFPADFHYCALLELLAVLDSLGIERAVWWGHSDGAVIAALAAIHAPHRVSGVILEGLHYYADKPRSRTFFQRMVSEPESFGDSVRRVLEAEHGERRWRGLLELDGQAWLDLAEAAATPQTDLYGGRLPEIEQPVLLVHGGRDPRTEPGELEAVRAALPNAHLSLHPEAGHSPHSESSREAVTDAVLHFFERVRSQPIR